MYNSINTHIITHIIVCVTNDILLKTRIQVIYISTFRTKSSILNSCFLLFII